jgi:hypothetical protein
VVQWLLWRALVPVHPNSTGMSPQRLVWCGSGGDGRTGLTTTGTHDPAGLTSRRVLHKHVEDIRGSRQPPFEGTACWSYGGRRHSVTELTLALPHSAEQRQGWPPPGSWRNSTGRDSQARQSSGATCCVRALNAHTRVREQVRAGAWERRARMPSSGAGPARGGAQPSSGAGPVRGAGLSPRARQTPPEGGVRASSEAGSTRETFAVLSWRATGATKIVFVLCMHVRCAS